jgi:hypothetical protein
MSLYDGTNGPLIKVYVDNAGLTPSAFVLGVSTLAPNTPVFVLSAVGNGTTIVFTCTNSFTVGQTVKVTGLTTATGVSLNGTYIISSRNATTFTVSSTKVGTTSGSGLAVVGDQLTTNTPYTSLVQIPSTDVRNISIRRGRTREDQTFQPGTMTLELDNWTGVYDPQMLNSTWSLGTYSYFSAGRAMRVTATWSGTEYNLYSGYIEQIDIDQTLNPIVTITCTDLLATLGSIDLTGIFGTSTGLGYYGSSAVFADSVCRAANINPNLYSNTGTTVAYLSTITTQSAYDILQTLATGQGGRSFVDRSGVFRFQDYNNIVPGSTSLTFSDQRTSATIEYDDIAITSGAKYLRNQVILTDPAGNSVTATNGYSSQQYGLRSAVLLSYGGVLGYSNTEFTTIANYLANHFATPSYRVDSISFDCMNLNGFGGSVWANFLPLELGQRVSVARTPIYTTATTYDCLVQSINHDISPTGWRTSLNLSPAN